MGKVRCLSRGGASADPLYLTASLTYCSIDERFRECSRHRLRAWAQPSIPQHGEPTPHHLARAQRQVVPPARRLLDHSQSSGIVLKVGVISIPTTRSWLGRRLHASIFNYCSRLNGIRGYAGRPDRQRPQACESHWGPVPRRRDRWSPANYRSARELTRCDAGTSIRCDLETT